MEMLTNDIPYSWQSLLVEHVSLDTAQSRHFDIGESFSDAIGTTSGVCTSGDFVKDDVGKEAKGYNVHPSEDRYLWFRFESPTSTSLTTQQTITVTITAEE